jgi:ketosteroid isomerase-like protein
MKLAAAQRHDVAAHFPFAAKMKENRQCANELRRVVTRRVSRRSLASPAAWRTPMGVASPDLMASAFADRFNAGSAIDFIQLFAEDALFTYDGFDKAVGRKQIEGALAGFMAAGLSFRGENLTTHVVGDTALTRFRWELVDASGAVAASGISAEVQRRGADGLWRLVIDDSGGGGRS